MAIDYPFRQHENAVWKILFKAFHLKKGEAYFLKGGVDIVHWENNAFLSKTCQSLKQLCMVEEMRNRVAKLFTKTINTGLITKISLSKESMILKSYA